MARNISNKQKLEIPEMLKYGVMYKDIMKKLRCSAATIARVKGRLIGSFNATTGLQPDYFIEQAF